jgi:type II secretory pathway component PulF
MPRYRYTGIDAAGRPVTGERDAPDPDALLAAIGNDVRQVQSVQVIEAAAGRPSEAGPAAGFHRGDELEISGHIAELIEARLPLESGLAAIAAECPSRRMRSALRGIVDDLTAGQTLEAALAGRGAPKELQALVRAGARSGNTGQILEHYVVNVQSAAELRQVIFRGLFYPLLIAALFTVIGISVLLWVVPEFLVIFSGFDAKLPPPTQWLSDASTILREQGGTVAIAVLAIIAGGVVLGRLLPGSAGFRRLICMIPVVGPIVRWVSLARFSQLLALLVENDVPLDEALMLAGAAAGDPGIQDDCRKLLAGVAAGESLNAVSRRLNCFPASFVQALTWTQRASGMPEILQSLGDIYASRVRAIVAVLVTIIPPVLLLLVGLAMLFVVAALFAPLIQLINVLS